MKIVVCMKQVPAGTKVDIDYEWIGMHCGNQ